MIRADRTQYQTGKEGAILAFDAGTSALKAALFSAEMELISLASVSYQARTESGMVEMEPGDYLGAMRECVYALGAPRSIAAIGMTTQGETLIPVGRGGEQLSRAVVWLDSRAEREASEIAQSISDTVFYETTGLPQINGGLPLSKLLWWKRNKPELLENTHQILLLEDYLRLWMTGTCLTHASLATSTGWLNVHTGEYWTEALAVAGIGRELLPQIVPSGAKAGTLTAQAANYLGLRAGIPVFTGAMDQTAAVFALSARKGTVCETLGTAHVVAAASEHPVFDQKRKITIYRHALKDQYVCLPIGNTGGMSLTWFLREFGKRGEDYAALDRLSQEAEAGCGGVTFLPYLCGCVNPEPIPSARAGYVGAKLESTRADFIRAILESAGYELRLFLELLREQGCTADTVTAIGGGAKSAGWTQMRADITGRTLVVPALTEASSAGAALLAGWGAEMIAYGVYPDALKKESAVFMPDESCRLAYDKGYHRFNALFSALRHVYDKEECF